MGVIKHDKQTLAFAGSVSIAGAFSMIVGAALWGASGTDLWQALSSNQMETYLAKLEPVKELLIANTVFWTLGVLLMGTAGAMMVRFSSSHQGLTQFTLACIRCAVPMAVVSFFIMLSLAIHPPTVGTAKVVGWIGARLDDLATILIVGASPLFLSIAGSTNWVPRWLVIWGYLAGVAGLLGIVGMLSGIFPLVFIIIPVGLGWMIAAGVVLIKKRKASSGI